MNPLKLTVGACLLSFGLVTAASAQNGIELSGTLRDFQQSHPDMEYPDKSFGLRQGIVQPTLGEDGKPVLNPDADLANAMIAGSESFNQWYRNVEGVNRSVPLSIELNDADGDGIYRFEASKHNGQSFFPIDGQLFGNEGNPHNYHFTFEIHTKFTYTQPAQRDQDMVFEFSGDDDVWVYINDHLVVDLGGVHSEVFGSVNVDTLADQLGLEAGQTYDFDFFFAERHLTESNFTIETTIQFLSPLYD